MSDNEDFSKKLSYWKSFFINVGLAGEVVEQYAKKFVDEEICKEILHRLNEEKLIQLEIPKMGHREMILLYIQKEIGKEKQTSSSFLLKSLEDEPPLKKLRRSFNLKTDFESIIDRSYFIDKTDMIECIIEAMKLPVPYNSGEIAKTDVLLITAPRRFGKTTNIDMLNCFFGGFLPRNKFESLKIGKSSHAMSWWGKFYGVFISFGHFGGKIKSEKGAISACREIIHASFKNYSYIESDLLEKDRESFATWLDETQYKNKTDGDVNNGIKFLVECVHHYCGKEKPVMLFVDEFDRICSRAMFEVESDTLNDIIAIYCDMIGNAARYEAKCLAILTGVSAITCGGLSGLNNIEYIRFLENEIFSSFYGITGLEFEELMGRNGIPETVRSQKEEAYKWYNGYDCCNKKLKILNTYSIEKFITNRKIGSYWTGSGLLEGLDKSLKKTSMRTKILDLLSKQPCEIKLMPYLKAKDFSHIQNDSSELIDCDLVLNFLLQQGYIAIDGRIVDGKGSINIPNREVEIALSVALEEYYKDIFKFSPEAMKTCADCLSRMDMSSHTSIEANLKEVKELLNSLLSGICKSDLNESWFESFLFSIFMQTYAIKVQKKIAETARNNDMRTAKVLDLKLESKNQCFIFEETLQMKSAEDALTKLIDKKYFIEAEKTKNNYILIGIKVNEDSNGFVKISMHYLVNTHVGDGIEV